MKRREIESLAERQLAGGHIAIVVRPARASAGPQDGRRPDPVEEMTSVGRVACRRKWIISVMPPSAPPQHYRQAIA
jgi:hypothetical protein